MARRDEMPVLSFKKYLKIYSTDHKVSFPGVILSDRGS